MLFKSLCAHARHGLALAGSVLILTALTFPAAAQDEAQIRRGKLIFANKATCSFCHGWAGDGDGQPRSDQGPSLRATELNAEQIREVVQCGRPDTGMPYHDRFAYTDQRCYGMTGEELGNDKPTMADATLQRAEIDAVVVYIMAKVHGRGEITLAECVEFWGEGAAGCAAYR